MSTLCLRGADDCPPDVRRIKIATYCNDCPLGLESMARSRRKVAEGEYESQQLLLDPNMCSSSMFPPVGRSSLSLRPSVGGKDVSNLVRQVSNTTTASLIKRPVDARDESRPTHGCDNYPHGSLMADAASTLAGPASTLRPHHPPASVSAEGNVSWRVAVHD